MLLNESGKSTPGGSQRASIEGLDDEELEIPEGETTGAELQDAPLLRARSVDYKNKGHARHISAGSARLLDIRRSSDVATKIISGHIIINVGNGLRGWICQ